MTTYQPTLHKPVPMGARVKTSQGVGTVAGISSIHVIFGYVVILDNEIQTEYGPMKAIVEYGAQLENVDGSNWRLTDQ